MATKRKVIHALFDYTRTDEAGRDYRATALRGEVVEVNEGDLARGERLGALVAADTDLHVVDVVPAPALPVDAAVAGKLLDDRQGDEVAADPGQSVKSTGSARPAGRKPGATSG